MGGRNYDLLEKAKSSPSQWKRRDIDNLYLSFGFIIINGANHDIVKHPDFPTLRATLPRHRSLHKVYVFEAIKLIEALLEILGEENEKRNS